MTAYQELESLFHRHANLRTATAVLQWDMAVMMPLGGAEVRAEQLAVLGRTCHDLITTPEIADRLDEAGGDVELDPWHVANLREMRRQWLHAVAVPGDLIEALSRATSRCETVWRSARADNDFDRVEPLLAEVLKLVREVAAAKAERLGVKPYEALMDEYEPGARICRIEALFNDLGTFLPGFLDQALATQAARPIPIMPTGPFPVTAQKAIGEQLMARLGFDFEHGRLDTSAHPFCGGVPSDVRITTRYDETDFMSALMGVLHETGHALYEAGLPEDWRYQPVGAPRGMALHESQSLLVEMQLCRSRPFLAFAAPLIRDAFGGDGPAWEAENLYRLNTRIERDFIRVDADEVTYTLHVIIRTQLERAMIAGDLTTKDLPGAWNESMKSMLNIVPPNNRLGCLQDIHWYEGAWGYFPTYTLGAVAAAQLFATARTSLPGLNNAIACGEFAPLVGWLRSNVHGKGSLLSTDVLLEEVAGTSLDAGSFKAHLEARYLD